MKILIYISWPVRAWSIPDEQVAALRARFPRIEFVQVRTLEDAKDAIVDVDACFTPRLTAEMVAHAPKLRWVHSSAAAVEGLLPLDILAERGIAVSNSRGIQAVTIAEHVMGTLLVHTRKLSRTMEAQRERRWIQNDLCDDWPSKLHGRSMTIVGLGTIGMELAKRAHAFGMTVTGVRRHTDRPRPRTVKRVVGPDQLNDALAGCDILVISAPAVAATNRMIGEAELALLNPGAIVVNVARAKIVDQDALRTALESGRLGGAVLDVFEREPLDAESPEWTLPNTVITPHCSGVRDTHWRDVIELYSANVKRFQNGRPLLNLVDPVAGY
ncbi:MAG TPA: D-2-hydroxyacid dehydrogenase [Gemmatimonadaceae bacterium]|jgi:phosphoglycerate dehydrogenase-like enzyme